MNRRNVLLGCIGSTFLSQAKARNLDLTFVVPSSPGGSSDISSRLLAASLDDVSKITVMNRSSGQGVEGSMFVLRSNPNSGILLIGGPNGLFFSPARENLSYNSDSFDPICMFSMASFAIVSKTNSFHNIDELLRIATSRTLNIGFSQSDAGYLIESLGQLTGSKFTAVGYRGGGDLAKDLHAGIVDAGVLSIASVVGAVQSGTLRLLAHTQDFGNVKSYPDVPKLMDIVGSTDPSLITYHWHGLYAPKGISQNISLMIQNLTRTICNNERFIIEHENRGMTSRYMDSTELSEHHLKMENYMKGYIQWLKKR